MTEISKEEFTEEVSNDSEKIISNNWEKVILFIAFSYGTYHFITAIYPLPKLVQTSIHLGFGVVLALLIYKDKANFKSNQITIGLIIIFIINVFRIEGLSISIALLVLFSILGFFFKNKFKTKVLWTDLLLIALLLVALSSVLLDWGGTHISYLVLIVGTLTLFRRYVSVTIISVLLSIYLLAFLYINRAGLLFSENGATILWGCLVVSIIATFIWLFMFYKKKTLSIPLYDLIAIIFVIGATSFIALNFDYIANNPGTSTTPLIILGGILLLSILEAARRTLGMIFPLLAIIFIAYGLFGPYFDGIIGHRGLESKQLIEELYLSFRGFYGTVTGVTATVIGIFIVFGSVLMVTGGGRTFIDLATLIAGKQVGGPAKVAVLSSGMFGLVNGSAAANVAVTGNFTIPLMKKAGYKPQFAAAVEAVASTGGQLVPPVMGAVVFVMAEMIDTPYSAIMKAAIIPAFLFYVAALMSVHFQSKKMNIKPIEDPKMLVARKDVITFGRILPLFGPFSILLYLIVKGYSPETSAFWATVLAITLYFIFTKVRYAYNHKRIIPILIGFITLFIASFIFKTQESIILGFIAMILSFLIVDSKETKLKLKKLTKGMIDAGKGLVIISVLAGCAQIIIVIIGQTGLGVKFSSFINLMNESSLLLGLVVAMVISLILGMGIPTVAAYVIAASVVGVPLIQAGIDPLTAHLFLFYFALLSGITPPICSSVFVAAAIAKANWIKTAMYSLRIGLSAFIIPFMFVYGEQLLMKGSLFEIIFSTITAFIGVVALTAGTIGYFSKKNKVWETVLLIIGAIMSIAPNIMISILGILFITIIYLIQKYIRKEDKNELSTQRSFIGN